jgi:hypothetical protein
MPEPVAVMVDRTQPGEDTEAELMLVAVDEEGGCTLSLDDGGALDLDSVNATTLALAILSASALRAAA